MPTVATIRTGTMDDDGPDSHAAALLQASDEVSRKLGHSQCPTVSPRLWLAECMALPESIAVRLRCASGRLESGAGPEVCAAVRHPATSERL